MRNPLLPPGDYDAFCVDVNMDETPARTPYFVIVFDLVGPGVPCGPIEYRGYVDAHGTLDALRACGMRVASIQDALRQWGACLGKIDRDVTLGLRCFVRLELSTVESGPFGPESCVDRVWPSEGFQGVRLRAEDTLRSRALALIASGDPHGRGRK